MALIKCPECGTEMSDMANACPKCAFPIKPNSVQTIEQTSKTLKLYYILSIALIVIGIFFGFTEEGGAFGGILFIVGIILYFGTKIGIWWNHK